MMGAAPCDLRDSPKIDAEWPEAEGEAERGDAGRDGDNDPGCWRSIVNASLGSLSDGLTPESRLDRVGLTPH